MNTFENLLSDSNVIRLLEYFGYHLTKPTRLYLTYSKSDDIYHVFIDDQGQLQIFDPSQFRQLNATELFLQLSKAITLQEITDLLPSINLFPDNTEIIKSSLTKTTLTEVINLIINLKQPDPELLPVLKTDQFKHKVFINDEKLFIAPLFHFDLSLNTLNKVINCVSWQGNSYKFLNSQSSCLTATNPLLENKYLFIVSNPIYWINFALYNYAPEYFLVLCHPRATTEFIDSLITYFDTTKFSKIFLVLSEDHPNNFFTGRFFSHLLNQKFSELYFECPFLDNRFEIKVLYQQSSQLDVVQMFYEIDCQLSNLILSNVAVDEVSAINFSSLESYILPKRKLVEISGRHLLIESLPENPRLAACFFNMLADKLGLSDLIKVVEM